MYIPSIPLVWDNQTKKDVPTDYLHQYFTEHQISHIRRKNTEERRYVCYLCRQPVKLQARKNETLVGGHRYYFKHSPNSRCEWKSPELTKADVYKGVQEGKQHFELKQLLQNTLSQLQDWDNAGADDKYFWDINHINRRKPDVYAAYHNQTIVFEIQLRSENPQTINERQNFYRNENIPLVWFSLENSELVNDEHQSECLDVKQVQKDIAFSNNGNWYIFNESLAQQSLANGQLTFIAKYYWPHIIADEIVFNWEEKTITFEQIAFVDGKIIYRDCIDEYNNLYSTLLDEAKQQVLRKIQDKKSKFKNWQEFIKLVKEVWPNLSLFEDLEWLKLIFNQEFDKRTVILKKQIVDTFCKNLDKPSYKRWSDIADKTSDLPFGIIKEANLKVVQNLMWILGFKPLKQLPPARACHNFHDYESFFPYFDLYVETRNLSPLRNEIANDQSIIKRQSKIPHDIEQKHDLDRFIDWFVSKPYLNVDDYNAR